MRNQRKRRKIIKRLISGVSAIALSVGLLGSIPASADDSNIGYKYTLFAYSSEDGAISSSAANFCVNGNIATNGTISAGQNFNVNGEKKEHANEVMPDLTKNINEKFFTENVDVKAENYSKNETNIEIKVPTDVKGKVDLNGNIQLSAGLKAMGDIALSGNVLNKNSTVLFSEKGNIVINTENANLTGLIYAPKGNITIESKNLNLNSVVMIANKITLNAPNININNSASMAKFVQESIDKNGNSSSGDENEEDPEPVTDPAIYAYGEYNEETKSVDIEWYSNVTGEFAVLESMNGTDYTVVSKVSDDTKYSIKVTSDFIKKHFKVATIKGTETFESIPFTIVNANGKYSTELLDTDKDGLADLYEEMLGTDKTLPDTDKDGLTDYEEVYITNTDPTKYDSVTDGVSDANADNDKDGLTNKREIELKTDPNSDDTDGDTLKDGDELSKYNTDPIKRDTDGDELEDDDEFKFNCNPNKKDTDNNGIIDGKEKHQQTLDVVPGNKEQAVTKVSVSMSASGNIEKTTTVESIMDKDVLCSNVVGLVGEPFSIESESSFEKATITFTVDKTKLGETEFDNLMFLWYDRENDNFVELETSHDSVNSTVSVETTHFSYYLIVDAFVWNNAWKKISELNNYYDSLNVQQHGGVSCFQNIYIPKEKTITTYITCCDDANDPYVLKTNAKSNTYTNYRSLIGDLLISSMRAPAGDINANKGRRQNISYNEKDDYITFLNIDYSRDPNSILRMDWISPWSLYYHYFTKEAAYWAADFYKSNQERQRALNSHTYRPGHYWNTISRHSMAKTRVVFLVDRDITKLCDINESVRMGVGIDSFWHDEGSETYTPIEEYPEKDKVLFLFAGPKWIRNDITIDFLCIGDFDKTNLEMIANAANGKVYDLNKIGLDTLVDQSSDTFVQTGGNLTVDNDEDGLPDTMEIKGIPLNNGEIITTDPEKTDTDNDGLKDGEELVEFVGPVKPGCQRTYHMNSDPTKLDSDKDGLDDKLDNAPLNPKVHAFVIYETINNVADLKIWSPDEEDDNDDDDESNDYPKDYKYSDKSKKQLTNMKCINWTDFSFGANEKDYKFNWILLAKLTSMGDMEDVAKDMINHFMSGSGSDYRNDVLTKNVDKHENTQVYVAVVRYCFETLIKEQNGELEALKYDKERYINESDTKEERILAKNKNAQDKRNEESLMVAKLSGKIDEFSFLENNGGVFGRISIHNPAKPPVYDDKLSGLGFCVDSLYGNRIEVSSYEFDGRKYKYTLHFVMYDIFGLDEKDIEQRRIAFMPFGVLAGFRSWYILQHYDKYNKKYKPYISYMEFDRTFEGEIS